MFGFSGGEGEETIRRKKGYRDSAKVKWPFLTTYDLSTIKTPGQLRAMIQTRASLSEQAVSADVAAWMEGKQF